jgi:hypothetical protein
VAQAVEFLPCKYKALSSNLSREEKKRTTRAWHGDTGLSVIPTKCEAEVRGSLSTIDLGKICSLPEK